MHTIPTIAALLGALPTLVAGEECRTRAILRDGGEVVQIPLDRADPAGDVLITAGARPDRVDVDVAFIVASGTVWARNGDQWVGVPTIGTAEGVLSRNHAVLETNLLSDASVAVIGLGSGGATIADQLARAGVGHLVLVDRDRLEVQNVGRHLCDLTDLGRRKTAALADRLRARNPGIRLDLVDLDVLSDPDGLAAAVAGCSVLVGATDSNPSRSLLNRLAVEAGKVAIFGFARTRAAGGDVVRVAPGGPCWDCIFPHSAPETEITSARSEAVPAYADAPVTVEPGLSLDIMPIALMCARLTLQEVVRGRGSALESLDQDLPGARFLWANRREGDFAGWKPMGWGYRDFAVHRWYGMKIARNPLCPTCNEDAFLAQLLGDAPEAIHACEASPADSRATGA